VELSVAYLVGLFEDINPCAIHVNMVKIMTEGRQLTRNIRADKA